MGTRSDRVRPGMEELRALAVADELPVDVDALEEALVIGDATTTWLG